MHYRYVHIFLVSYLLTFFFDISIDLGLGKWFYARSIYLFESTIETRNSFNKIKF